MVGRGRSEEEKKSRLFNTSREHRDEGAILTVISLVNEKKANKLNK